MTTDYPHRPMAPDLVRYPCMIFGLAGIVSAIVYAVHSPFIAGMCLLVGAAWFAFGKYGGLPLAETVIDWSPPTSAVAIEEMHRRGLLVMRRRRWMMYLAVPVALAAILLLASLIEQPEHLGLVVFPVFTLLATANLRYALSRCPRCGLGFFTKSTRRAASLRLGKTCGHCGLSLHAYKQS